MLGFCPDPDLLYAQKRPRGRAKGPTLPYRGRLEWGDREAEGGQARPRRRQKVRRVEKRSEELVDVIVPLPIEGPEIRGELEREAVESVMRVVWPATGKGMTGEEKRRVLRANFGAIGKHTSDLADKAVRRPGRAPSAGAIRPGLPAA